LKGECPGGQIELRDDEPVANYGADVKNRQLLRLSIPVNNHILSISFSRLADWTLRIQVTEKIATTSLTLGQFLVRYSILYFMLLVTALAPSDMDPEPFA
jgi:hypothetical protein